MIYNAHDDNKTITFASSMQIKAGGHPLRHLATKKTTTQALATSSHRNGTISPSRDLSVAEGGGALRGRNRIWGRKGICCFDCTEIFVEKKTPQHLSKWQPRPLDRWSGAGVENASARQFE